MRYTALMLVALAGHALTQTEADGYRLEPYVAPDGEVIEVGGLAFASATDLLVSTRRGRVWWIENALAADPADAVWHVFCEGLHEGLGLAVVDGTIWVVQRGELSTLHDHDGDRRCDEVRTVTLDWGMSGNYHEFAFGLPRDPAGHFYVALNLGFFDPDWWHGDARARWRGWILRVDPATGATTPFAHGVRSPAGLGSNQAGEIFYTDNQGDWVAACPIYHVQEGAFYGHPASLRWTAAYGHGERAPSKTEPPDVERADAAVWLPYAWSRSAGNLIEDRSGGRFGPYQDQLFVAELTNGMVLRAQLEKVRGEYQGAAFLFRRQLGSVSRIEFAPDGETMILGYTNRGWGGRGPGHGLARLRWTGETPFDIHSVSLRQDGFELRFTEPLAGPIAPADVRAVLYHYNYWWEYGSPVVGRTPLEVTAVEPGATPDRVRIRIAGLEPARCIQLSLANIRSAAGAPLLHDTFHYTINQLPEGPRTALHVNRLVEPPVKRGDEAAGWLHLTWGDATGLWDAGGWQLCDVELATDDPSRLETRPGIGALVDTGETGSAFASRVEVGDCEFWFRFMLPRGGRGTAWFLDRYPLDLVDGEGPGVFVRGAAPTADAGYLGHGNWHKVTGRFYAARYDEQGRRVEDARFEDVRIDDLQVVTEAIASADQKDSPEPRRGPIVFRAEPRALCLGDVRVRALDDASRATAGTSVDLLTGADLPGWTSVGDATWSWSDGVLRASGGAGRLVSTADDWHDVELRLRLIMDAQGDAGLRFAWDGEDGYEADIQCNPNGRTKVGSVVGLRDVHTDLVPSGTRFDYVVRRRRTDAGDVIQVFVDGIEITSLELPDPPFGGGRIALEIGAKTSLIVESFSARRL